MNHYISKTRPHANKENVIYYKNYRITLLKDRLIRLEQNDEKEYRDEATQSIWFRDFSPVHYKKEERDGYLFLQTNQVSLFLYPSIEESFVEFDGKKVKISNEGNLLSTFRTLDGCDGEIMEGEEHRKVPLEDGIASLSGVAYFDDANSLSMDEEGRILSQKGKGKDLYLFVYGHHYEEALHDYYEITGFPPIVPRFALGNWWSRFYPYTEKSYLSLMEDFKEHDVPLTVATIDMDWHYFHHLEKEFEFSKEKLDHPEIYGNLDGWTGYTWNRHLFPSYPRFLKKLHQYNLKVTLNLHPALGIRFFEDCYVPFALAMGKDPAKEEQIPFDLTDEKFLNAYFEILHHPYEDKGVDFWWIDWQQGTQSKMDGYDPLWALNHFHYLDQKNRSTMPLILSRYAGRGSHRYPLGFSGDTYITWDTLAYLPYFTSRATNIGYTWWSHDIGGHMHGEQKNELYLRFIQFGVFSPILRLHSSDRNTLSKEPWIYQNGCGELAMKFLRLRHAMLPLLYTASYLTSIEGKALIRPLYYAYDVKEAYELKNEYLFTSLLVSPIVTPLNEDGYSRVDMYIPEGRFVDFFTNEVYELEKGEVRTLLRTLDSIPVLVPAGSVIPLSFEKGNHITNPKRLTLYIYQGTKTSYLYEDDAVDHGISSHMLTFNTSLETKGKQILEIKEEGSYSFSRTMEVVFKDIQEGKISLYENGKKKKIKYLLSSHELKAEFHYESGKTYRLEVEFDSLTRLEELKKQCEQILLTLEEPYETKEEFYYQIKKASSLEEYKEIIAQSHLNATSKEKLLETRP